MTMNNKPIETLELAANGLTFAARAAGSGPLVLCLHGFPDSPHTWDSLLPRLAGAGYRAVAPFLRGYAPTDVPADGDYSIATLGLDAIGLADALGEKDFYIVGHDWGAIMAYSAASYAPTRIRGIVTAAVPPMRRFLGNMNPAQFMRSWYIAYFQLPLLPQQQVRRNNCKFVDRIWQAWSPQWAYGKADIAPVKNIFSRPQNCQAALGYYRALPRTLFGPRNGPERRQIFSALNVPARVICGEQDGCIGAQQFAGTQNCFTQPCELVTMQAGHFMHREQPGVFNDKVLEFLANRAAARH